MQHATQLVDQRIDFQDELFHLLIDRLAVSFEIDYYFYLHGRMTAAQGRLYSLANKMINDIAAILGEAVKEVYKEFSKRQDLELWNTFYTERSAVGVSRSKCNGQTYQNGQ